MKDSLRWAYALNQWNVRLDVFVRHEDQQRALKTVSACGFDHIELASGTGRWDNISRPEVILLNHGSHQGFLDFLRRAKVQGVSSMFWDPQSPAERAGITAGDVLVAYNGVDVVNHEFNLSTLLKPDSKVAVTVRREGEAKDFQLVVAKAPQRIIDRRLASEMPPMRRDVVVGPRLAPTTKVLNVPSEGIPPRIFPASPLFVISSNGVFGASVSTVNTDLARALNLRAGVLVNEVPEDSPAFRAGLRTGDVIIGVADQPVVSLTELRRALAQTRERAVSLQVTSPNQKPRTVTISLVPSP